MVAPRQSQRRPVFRRLTALEVLEEAKNDTDSAEEDLYGGDDNDSEVEEDHNSHHPLLQDTLMETESDHSDGEVYVPENESDSDSDSNESASDIGRIQRRKIDSDVVSIPSTSRAVSPVNVRCGRGRGARHGRTTCSRGCGRGRGAPLEPNSFLIRHWESATPQAPNQDLQFLGNPGLQRDINDFSPVEFLQLFFDEDLLNHLVIQTNLYAQAYIDSNPSYLTTPR